MFCGKCGKENLAGVRYCVGCGADLESLTVRGGQTHPPGGAPAGAGSPATGAATGASTGGLAGAPPSELAVTMDPSQLRTGREIRPGMVLSGQFRIAGDKPLGAGGMGEVWKAEDLELGAPVAIKVLPPMLARNEQAVGNLKKEAMIGRQLTHRSICRLYSFHSDGEIKFIVMEFVQGRTLQQLLQQTDGGRLTWERAAPIAAQIAEALDYAHNVTYTDSAGRVVRGVLHRDIKPGNIMVTEAGEAKLMDFGIAREMHDTMTEVTGRTSQTPLYASPEQFRGAPVTAASDVYSFATVLYECLAGQRYVTAHGDIAYQVLQKPFEPLGSLPAEVNAGLAAGLSKDPQARPASAGALVARMQGAVSASGAVASGGLRRSHEAGDTTHAGAGASPQASDSGAVASGGLRRSHEAGDTSGAGSQALSAALAQVGSPARPSAPGPTRRQIGILVAVTAVLIGAGVTLAILLTRSSSQSPSASNRGGAGGSANAGGGASEGAPTGGSVRGGDVRGAGVSTGGAQGGTTTSGVGLPFGAASVANDANASAATQASAQVPAPTPTPTPAPAPSPAASAEAPKAIANTLGMKFLHVAPGEFKMGSPPDEPSRESGEGPMQVKLTKGFYLGATEVTQAQYQAVMSENPSYTRGENLPADGVTYVKAVEFCDALGKKDGRKYRLPTEAEWEYACRAGTTTPYSTGKALTTEQANFDGTMLDPNAPPGKDRGATTPAGSLPANPWGFCDMHGNVWEWCADFHASLPGGEAVDPAGPKTGTFMVLRGGSYRSKAADCRSASRYKEKPANSAKHVGFRVAMDP